MKKNLFTVFVIISGLLSYSFVFGEEDSYSDESSAAIQSDFQTVENDNQGISNSCSDSTDKNSLCSPSFEIDVKTFTPGGKSFLDNSNSTGTGTSTTASGFFSVVIQKLTIWLGSLALLIMTIGAGFMILYHGQDDLLSKGKTIFTSGILALVVALSSYYLVALLRYLLFT